MGTYDQSRASSDTWKHFINERRLRAQGNIWSGKGVFGHMGTLDQSSASPGTLEHLVSERRLRPHGNTWSIKSVFGHMGTFDQSSASFGTWKYLINCCLFRVSSVFAYAPKTPILMAWFCYSVYPFMLSDQDRSFQCVFNVSTLNCLQASCR